MELHQAGLIDEWTERDLQKRRNVTYCLNEARNRQQRKITNNLTKITLKNFSGAFCVLIIGYILSLICFIGENVYFKLSKYQKQSTDCLKLEIKVELHQDLSIQDQAKGSTRIHMTSKKIGDAKSEFYHNRRQM